MYFLAAECSDIQPLVNLIKGVVKLIQYGIPIILILLIVIDLGRAVMANKEDEMEKFQKVAIKRAIYALVIFFVPFIVNVVFKLVDNTDATDGNGGTVDSATIMSCWNK